MSDSKEAKTNGNKTTGYHLFFEPENSLRGELQEIITKLADENHAPRFPTHVTLLAEIPTEPIEALQEKAQKLAGMLSPLELTLGELGADGKYFRALYISIKEQPEIITYYKQALAVFGMKDAAQNEEAYAPHLSLLQKK
jgi:2'-5' RNA ligase